MSGFVMTFNQFTGGTLSMTFQRYASGFATLTDMCEVPDPEYVKMNIYSHAQMTASQQSRLQLIPCYKI